MTEERLDAWLGELRSELAAAPSPRMAAGIRARVASHHRRYLVALRGGWRSPVRLAMAATVAAIAVGTAATFWFRTSTITPAVERQPVASTVQVPTLPVASVVA